MSRKFEKFKRRRTLHEKRFRFQRVKQEPPSMSTGDSIQASIIPDLESPCLYLDISVNGRQLSALFDTGSPISVVTAELCGDREVLPYGNRFRSCTGHSLDIVGYTIMDFVFESRLCPIPCVVVRNSAYPVLLGMNWIRKHIQPEDDIWRARGGDDVSGSDPTQVSPVPLRDDRSPVVETDFDGEILSIDACCDAVDTSQIDFVLRHRTPCPGSSVVTIDVAAVGMTDGYYVIEPSDSIMRYPMVTIPNALVMIRGGVSAIQIVNRSNVEYVFYPQMKMAVGRAVQVIDSRVRRYSIPEDWIEASGIEIPRDVYPILEQYVGALSGGTFAVAMEPVAIPTGEATPVFRRPYKLGQGQRDKIREHVAKMIDEGVVRESSSCWGAPCFLVEKKSGDSRLVVDYTGLNRHVEPDYYPLIDLNSAVQSLSGSSWFSHLDLDAAYHQIPIALGDVEKSCFVTEDGAYEYLFAPFGLNRSGAALARNLDRVLGPLTTDRVINYSDDIIAHGEDRRDALEALDMVLTALASCGLKINLSKCVFLVREISFLGFVVSSEGVLPDPKNVKPVMDIQQIVDKKQLSRFVNFAGFYRQFIRGFASVVRPLRELLANKDWNWTPQCQVAFVSVRDALVKPPVLIHFDPVRATTLKTDASKDGYGAVLTQNDGNRDYVVAYASRKTTEIESRSWAVTHLELGAVVFAVGHFRRFLQNTRFTLLTDHHALCWLLGKKNVTGKLARWTLTLQEFNFDVKYVRPGLICDADCLSRVGEQSRDGIVNACFKTQENAQVTIPPKPLSPQTQENAQVTIPPKPLSPQIQIAQGPIVPRPPSPQTPLSPGPGQHIPSPTQPSTSWAGARGFTPPLPPPLPMQQSTSRAGAQGFVPPLPPSPPMQQDPRPQRRPQTPRPRGDSNPSRRPIERDPYLLRDRSGSRGKR